MISQAYKAQVDLLLQVLPYVAKEEIFALKGGTAINLFIREMPRLSVDIDLTYLPLDSRIEALKNIQDLKLEVQWIHSSKWLNGITVKTETEDFTSKAGKLSFVKSVQFTKPLFAFKSGSNKFVESESHENAPIDTSIYGESVYQTGLLNGQYLHNQNYKGKGIDIAVLDAGFYNVDAYPAFDSLWANDQILGVKDFVEPDSSVFVSDYHGMSVLSCMGGNVPGRLIGTAAKSSFWLLRSEDGSTEYLIEEDNWVAAAEYADSVGVDIINSSLGYYQFDDPAMNHTYSDMDGKTTRVTQAANIAATKGILVFSSAGNEGNKAWKYIIAPSDGEHVIGVGATNELGVAASFTSYGPASDGDIKPNVSALGWSTFLQRSDGSLGYSNGTSFSSPVMAGMAACLWQANPDATAFEVKQAIEQSASLYSTPDSLLGYGIPDMRLADQILGPSTIVEWRVNKNWQAYPNPVKDYIVLQQKENKNIEEVNIEILSVDGRSVRKWKKQGSPIIVLNKLGVLPGGILLLKISTNTTSETIKLFKYR